MCSQPFRRSRFARWRRLLPAARAERAAIPVMSVSQYEALAAAQRPTEFRDSDPRLAYPYNIHETDGLSRNPDDCVRWGCVDNTNR